MPDQQMPGHFKAVAIVRRLLVLSFVLGAISSDGQIVQNTTYSNTYTPFKYSLIVGDLPQMAHDGSSLIKKLSLPLADYADLQYYRGHYSNAAGGYFNAITSFAAMSKGPDPVKDPGGTSGFSTRGLIASMQTSKLDDASFRAFGGAAISVGMLFHTRGKFSKAEEVYRHVLEYQARRLGKTSREYVSTLHNMAVLLKDLGQYEESEKMFNYLVPAFRKLYGANSIPSAVVLNNKAMLLAELGRTREAMVMLDEVLAVGQQVFTAEYIDYERVLTNRALMEQEMGNLGQAEILYKQVMAGMEKKEFEDHPDYNNVLINYGSLLVQKDDRSVLAFITEIAEKIRKRYGEQHPVYAKALTNIGEFHLRGNGFATALAVFQKVAQIQRAMLGERHKDYLKTLMKIGVCQWQMNETTEAAAQFREAISSYMLLVDQLFPSLSEAEKSKFWASLRPNLEIYISFVTGTNRVELFTEAYELHMRTKGMLINATTSTRKAILESGDSVLAATYAGWLNAKDLLATYYSSPVEDVAEDKIDLAQLEASANALERKLSVGSSRFSETYGKKNVTYAELIASLKPREAAVEMVRIAHAYGSKKGEVEYVGWLAKAGHQQPDLIRFPDGNSMEKRSLKYYKNAVKGKLTDEQSYGVYWKPIAVALANMETVYVSLDGVYNNINLNTLQKEDKSYVIDKSRIILVPNTRFLVGRAGGQSAPLEEQQVLLVGSPDFGDSQVVSPLPGTKVEVETIGALLSGKNVSVKLITGAEATEESIKTMKDPAVLHIATHGYFLSDISASGTVAMGVQISRAKDNPLLRSGLMLAGAAAAFSTEPVLSGANNGLLNAYEAMNLNLRNTRLVIMSACETGAGEIVNGEGVYGLSRAFQVAGAKQIIMSLWKVDDAATEQLMTKFYQEWLTTRNPQQAFITAQRTLKATFPEPFYWGGFVMMGE